MVGTLRLAHPTTTNLVWKPRPERLQRHGQSVREIRHRVIEAAEQDDLENLRFIIMRRQRGEFGLAQGRAMMQRVDGGKQRPLRLRPARRVGGGP